MKSGSMLDQLLKKRYVPGTILVFKEEHGSRYFDASSVKAAGQACRKILKERLTNGFYSYKGMDEELTPPALSKEQVDALPACSAKDVAAKELWNYQMRLANQEKNLKFLADVKRALETNDDALAIALVQCRRDAQYESAESVHLEKP